MIGPRKLYAAFEAEVGPQLTGSGFVLFEPGSFQRHQHDGEDVVIVDPDPKRGRFSVLLAFYPAWTDVIVSLSEEAAQRGFPCGPYLSPVGVGRREHFWSYKTPKALGRSLQSVSESLAGIGLPWLAELRDARKFAAAVDPVAALYAGLAWEKAGEGAAARTFFEEVYRRTSAAIALQGRCGSVPPSVARTHLFVSEKLGV